MIDRTRELAEENERLLRFLYQVPTGLLMMRGDGSIEMLNPEVTRLLVPVTSRLMNLYEVLASSAPDLRRHIADFSAPSGLVWDQRRLRLQGAGPGGHEVMVAATIYRLETDAYMVSLQEIAETLRYERELRQNSAALQDSEQRFRLMADASPGMIWTSGPGGEGDYYNRAWLEFTGRSMEEERDDGWIDNIHPEDRERCVEAYSRAVNTRSLLEEDYRMRRCDGLWRWVSDRAAPRFTPEGVFAGHVGSCLDITDRIEAAQAQAEAARAAAAASDAKSRFLATVSHEIRTPLTAILGLGELAASEPEEARLREYAGLIRNAGADLLALINDLLDFSKLEAGAVSLERIPFNLRELLDSLHGSFAVLASGRGLELLLGLEVGLPQIVQGDPLRLRQVLSNLLSNAIKFTPEGQVELQVDRDVSGITFSVRDTGIGLSQQQIERVFSPFTQADESTTRRFGGTGLGLTISAELVRMMGGELGVTSVPGAGACFTFTLPLPAASMPVPEPLGRPQPEPGCMLSGRRVLLVEDVPVNQLVARKFLERDGMSVSIANNGEVAVEMACRPDAGFDLILMDVHMPEMDGLEATRQIVSRLGADCPPIVAMTAYALPEELERCRQAGMVDCLTKPIDVKLLSETLGRLLACG